MSARRSVCLFLEGSYPYVRGGVGMWAHDLIARSPQYDFSVVAVTDGPRSPRDYRYDVPEHVREIVTVNLREPVPPQELSSWRMETARRKNELVRALAGALTALEGGDRSPLPRLIRLWDKGPFDFHELFFHPELWGHFVEYARRVEGKDSFSRLFWTWEALFQTTLRLLRARLPTADVYHSASTGYAGLLACLAKVRTGRPFVLSEHGLYLQERQMELAFHEKLIGAQRDFVEKFFDEVSRWCYQSADAVTSLCGPIREHQLEMGAPADKAVVIPNGIDVDYFAGMPKQKHNGFHVGLVGRVVPVKDVKLLILAAKELLPFIPDLRVSIVGPCDDEDYLRECRDLLRGLDLEDVVAFTGFLSPELIYPELDLLVLCSLKEVQPLAVLEAMAARIPVVATRSGGLPEILSGIGALVPPRNLEQLVHTIRRLHSDGHLRESMARRGFERVSTHYSHARSLARFHDLYQGAGARQEAAAWPASV